MFLAAFAALALHGGAHPPPLVQPAAAWPRPEDIARVYPPEALRRRIGAKVIVGCKVGRRLELKDCRVLAEEPGGWGFGGAALELVAPLRLEPKGPYDGGSVRIPLRFAPPADAGILPVRAPAEMTLGARSFSS